MLNLKRNIPENQLYLPNGKLITFNPKQFEGLQKMKYWVRNGGQFFVLSGFAGTGKSLSIKKLLDSYRKGVAVTAPTHKAKKVIMNATGRPGMTPHSLVGLRPNVDLDDFNPNNPIFDPIAEPRINSYNLIVLDESSMVNVHLLDLIVKTIKNRNVRVLFMGDPAQIPPVGELESAVFNMGLSHKAETFHYDLIERQKDGNPLLEYYTIIRENLLDSLGGIKRVSSINTKGEGIHFTLNKKEFRKSIIDKFASSDFQKDSDYVKVIAWRNSTVREANKVIRSVLFPNESNFVVGDLLMGYRTVPTKDMKYNIIENSGDYHVISKSDLFKNETGIKGYKVTLKEDLGNNEYNYEDVFIVDHEDYDNLHLFGEMHDFFVDVAREDKKKWHMYYDFRRNNLLLTDITTYRNGFYRSDETVIKKDFDYAYAITAHKSMGSTYSHVYVMENDVHLNPLVKERNRIMYVALTRPTTTATVLTTRLD